MTERQSFLQSAIPANRGPAAHIEQPDDFAMTQFNTKGEVEAIFTPQHTLQRIHEVMHARHTDALHGYADGTLAQVKEIVEDCRLHTRHWPWKGASTPAAIREDVVKAVRSETAAAAANLSPEIPQHTYPIFATKLRASAVCEGIAYKPRENLWNNAAEKDFAELMLYYIRSGHHALAAHQIQKLFFEQDANDKGDQFKPTKVKPAEAGASEQEQLQEQINEMIGEFEDSIPKMITTELPLTDVTINPTDGYRLATSGARIYRPALRRPVLPQRLFIKRCAMEPAGAILFDASGSMDVDAEVLLDCCRRAPTATVAFYSGEDGPHAKGYMYVFAKDGVRANNIDRCKVPGGNTVDGHALDWLMKQDGPKMFVTDRQFCGSRDSIMQIARLQRLEETGLVTVYESYHEFREEFDISKEAA